MFAAPFHRIILAAGAVAAFALGTSTGMARAGEVQNRLNHQQARINQGVRSGALTKKEARRDERHLKHIEANRNADLARNGGHLTPAEQQRLNTRLNHNSTRVYNTKHNGYTRPGA